MVVVNWNRRDLTLECLASVDDLECEGSVHTVVVDNGSTDGSVEALRANFPEVSIVEMGRNAGFAVAANAGIREAQALGSDWTLLLNNDATVASDLLTRLLAAASPGVGLLAPTITVYGEPDVVWPAAGKRRRLTLAAVDTTAQPPSALPYDVDWAVGCCLLVNREVWAAVGPFDERYAVYYEDHDLCLRARDAGWRIVHVPSARATHRVAATAGHNSPRQLYLLARSSVPFFWRHTRGLHRAFIVPYRVGSFAATLGRALARRDLAGAWAYTQGLADGLAELRHA